MVAFLVGLFIGGIMIAVTRFLIAPYVYPLFGLSDTAASISTMMLTMVFLFTSVRSFNCTNIVGVLRGGGDVRMAALLDVLPLWLVSIPLAALCGLVLHAGIFWVYLSTFMENVVKFFFGLRRFRSGIWINDVTRISYKKENN